MMPAGAPDPAQSQQNLAHLGRLARLRNDQTTRTLTADETAELEEHPGCVHCGGYHIRACPRVKRIVFRVNTSGVHEVEYWPAHEIDWTGVLFPDVSGVEEGEGGVTADDFLDPLDVHVLVAFVQPLLSTSQEDNDVVMAVRRLAAVLEVMASRPEV